MKRLFRGEAYRPYRLTGSGIFSVTIQLLLNNHREHRVHRDNFFENEIDENFIFNSFVYFRI
ncbi:MAG: hypothetical protein LBJ00_03300 [Planctomycetaceae bacterium]|nr:hypothetical protein [Planctomycetaceae bacterium]